MTLRRPALAAILLVTPLYADFSYDQTTRITGGAMVGMMKMAGAFSKDAKKALEPMQATFSIKGNRAVHKTADSVTITDLDAETITRVDYVKKTYSVITFAQMKQAMEEMAQKMKKGKQPEGDLQYDVKMNDTGNTKSINGNTAHETIMTITMQGTDAKSGAKGGIDMTMDMWIAPKISGYDEVRAFYKRMGEKLAWTPGANPMFASQPGMSEAVARMYKEGARMDGMPVLQIVKMGGNMEGMPTQDDSQSARQQQQQQQQQSSAPPTSISGALGGMLAGRMAKRKKDDAASSSSPDSGSASGSLVEMTIETTSFSSSAADSALFQVPAGFTKVEEDPMGRGRKR